MTRLSVILVLFASAISHECPEGITSCNNITSSNDTTQSSSFSPSRLKALSMVSEDTFTETAVPFQPTPVHPSTSTSEPKGRSINFHMEDHTHENGLVGKYSHREDLSDVTMDEDDDQQEIIVPKILVHENSTTKTPGTFCTKAGLTYEHGEKLENECHSVCMCNYGKMDCTERCVIPYVRKGKVIDPLCEEKESDDACCSVVVCQDVEASHCTHNNMTYRTGEKFEDCESRCTCEEKGRVACVPRCPSIRKTSESCVEVTDPLDKCCKKVLCDVTLEESEKEDELIKTTHFVVNRTTYPETSKVKISTNATEIKDRRCNYKGRQLKMGEEFNDNCTSLCFCRQNGVQCLPLDCPTYFGVDVLNPNCIEWDTDPPNFVPSPPVCCPKSIKCKNTGSCTYKDVQYNNWQQIPVNVTGCEQRCFCEMGNVECQNICPPVAALPPANLGCSPNKARLGHLPDDDCCLYWTCKDGDGKGMYPGGGFVNVPGYQSQDEIVVHTLEALDAHTIRLAFGVPPVIVGLHGRVEVRYTYKENNDLNTWQLQVFAPPNDLIETPQLEFDLLGLKEDSEYKIKITITLRDLHNTPTSRVYTVRTLKDAATTLSPIIPIEPNLAITEKNATWVTLSWRKFTEFEMQFIDGVQIRYKEIDGKIYAATPLIHRAVTSHTIEGLKPDTNYEAGIFLVPFAGQQTELRPENMVHFTTGSEVDSYGFNVTLDIGHVKATSVEITWAGVPYPEDKYVNIYRAIYQSDSGKGDFSTFKLAKRDAPPKATIMDLKPGIRYRLWLEVYLTNGRIKTSNVQDFITRPRSAPAVLGKLEASSESLSERRGDYYGPLVIVAILAAIAILSTLILLLILVKRHNQNKAAITAPNSRVTSQSAYDNPTYKVEIQQETMDL